MNLTELYCEDSHWVKFADSTLHWRICFNPDNISVCWKMDTS